MFIDTTLRVSNTGWLHVWLVHTVTPTTNMSITLYMSALDLANKIQSVWSSFPNSIRLDTLSTQRECQLSRAGPFFPTPPSHRTTLLATKRLLDLPYRLLTGLWKACPVLSNLVQLPSTQFYLTLIHSFYILNYWHRGRWLAKASEMRSTFVFIACITA